MAPPLGSTRPFWGGSTAEPVGTVWGQFHVLIYRCGSNHLRLVVNDPPPLTWGPRSVRGIPRLPRGVTTAPAGGGNEHAAGKPRTPRTERTRPPLSAGRAELVLLLYGLFTGKSQHYGARNERAVIYDCPQTLGACPGLRTLAPESEPAWLVSPLPLSPLGLPNLSPSLCCHPFQLQRSA